MQAHREAAPVASAMHKQIAPSPCMFFLQTQKYRKSMQENKSENAVYIFFWMVVHIY